MCWSVSQYFPFPFLSVTGGNRAFLEDYFQWRINPHLVLQWIFQAVGWGNEGTCQPAQHQMGCTYTASFYLNGQKHFTIHTQSHPDGGRAMCKVLACPSYCWGHFQKQEESQDSTLKIVDSQLSLLSHIKQRQRPQRQLLYLEWCHVLVDAGCPQRKNLKKIIIKMCLWAVLYFVIGGGK